MDPAESLFEGTSVPRFEFTVAPEALDALRAAPDVYVKGDLRVTLNGKTLDLPTIGLRLKGQAGSGRTLDQKAGFLVRFDKYTESQRLLGLKKLALNNMVQDQSMLHERLGYTLFREMKVPAPRSAYATVSLNGALYGLYATIEATDNPVFLKHWFGSSDGNLYEGEYGSDLYVGLEHTFDQDKGADVGFTDLTELVQALDQMNDPATFLTDVSQVIDIDSYIRYAATELAIGLFDGYAAHQNNYYIYRRPSDKRWVFIPWGIDETFTQYTDPWVARGRVQQMCVASLPCKLKLAQAYLQVMDTLTRVDLRTQALSLGSLLWPSIYADPRKEVSAGTVYEKMVEVIGYLDNRPADLQSRVGCIDPATCPPCQYQAVPGSGGGRLAFCTLIPLNFSQAEADCVTQGGHLLSLHDQATHQTVVNMVGRISTGRWWLGLNDQAEEGTYIWTDWTPLDYSDWSPGEPNNDSNNEDCIQMYGEGGAWNDVNCEIKSQYICALP